MSNADHICFAPLLRLSKIALVQIVYLQRIAYTFKGIVYFGNKTKIIQAITIKFDFIMLHLKM